MIGDPACVPLVLAQEPGGGQQREVLQPGELPDLLDVTDLLLRAVVDAERVPIRVGPPAGHRVAEPVGPLQVGAEHPQGLPLPPQQPVRGLQHRLPGLLRHPRGGARRQHRGERQLAGGRRRSGPGQLMAGHLPR